MNKKILSLILIIIIIVLGYFLFFNKNSQEKAEESNQDSIVKNEDDFDVEFEDQSLIGEGETKFEDWKIYQDQEFKITLEYPKDWIADRYKDNKVILFGEQNGEVFNIGLTVMIYNGINDLWENEKGLNLEEWVAEKYAPSDPADGESLESGSFGKNNYQGFIAKYHKEIGASKLITDIFIENNGLIYEFLSQTPVASTANFDTEYNYDEVFNQMMSTLAFIE